MSLTRLASFVLVGWNWLGARIPLILEKPGAMAIQMLIWRVLLPALPASLGGLPGRF